jgi:CheY-like chemotaxis protein
LRLLAAGSYRAVFLDYDLPDMSGLEVARRLRTREAGLTHTMVIATTAYSTVQDREACLTAGMDSFLGKPITPEKLHAALTGMPASARPAASVQLPAETDASVNLRLLAFLAGATPGALQGEISRYLGVLQTLHLELIDALVTRDRPVLGRAAHRLVSHARMVDAEELTAIARAIEDAADFAEETELERMGGQLASAIFALKKTLARHLPARSPA